MLHSGLEDALCAVYGRSDDFWHGISRRPAVHRQGGSPSGSSASRWNGEAVWTMAWTPSNALSNAPGCRGLSDQQVGRMEEQSATYRSDILHVPELELITVFFEELVEVRFFIGGPNGAPNGVPSLQKNFDDVYGEKPVGTSH